MIRTCVFLPGGKVERDVPVTSAYEPPTGGVAWVDMEAPSAEELALLLTKWRFHPLAVEDCEHPQRLSKIDRYPSHTFLVFHALDKTTPNVPLDTLAVRIFLREGLVVTVRPRPCQAMERVWADTRQWPERFGRSAAALVHVLVDAMVDELTQLLYTYEERVDALQARAIKVADRRLVPDLVKVRHDLLLVRRMVLPQREVLRRFTDADDAGFPTEVRIYFRDVLDHADVVHDTANLLLDMCTGTAQIHADIVNERLNQVMKYMAIVSTLLLPMTVISGAFGMNFAHIPMSAEPNGFGYALLMMVGSALALLTVFRLRRWF